MQMDINDSHITPVRILLLYPVTTLPDFLPERLPKATKLLPLLFVFSLKSQSCHVTAT